MHHKDQIMHPLTERNGSELQRNRSVIKLNLKLINFIQHRSHDGSDYNLSIHIYLVFKPLVVKFIKSLFNLIKIIDCHV